MVSSHCYFSDGGSGGGAAGAGAGAGAGGGAGAGAGAGTGAGGGAGVDVGGIISLNPTSCSCQSLKHCLGRFAAGVKHVLGS